LNVVEVLEVVEVLGRWCMATAVVSSSFGTLERHRVSELVEDFSVYPRDQVDMVRVAVLTEALRAGAEFPPIIAEARTLRVVDGFHRRRAYLSVYGPDHEIVVEVRSYASDADLLLDATIPNCTHGKPLATAEKLRVARKLVDWGMPIKEFAPLLAVRADWLQARLINHFAESVRGEPVVLRPALRHLAGQKLTASQEAVNRRVGGLPLHFYARALVEAIQVGVINTSDRLLMERLQALYQALGLFLSQYDLTETP
jgi:hypothetical protein